MLPPCSSMHVVNDLVASAQLLPQELFCVWAAGAAAAALCWTGSAGAEEPPPKKPPMAWPMEEPTATPLCTLRLVSRCSSPGRNR